MSLGETPDILDAWASVVGDIFINFSFASLERDFIEVKSKSFGILRFSRRLFFQHF